MSVGCLRHITETEMKLRTLISALLLALAIGATAAVPTAADILERTSKEMKAASGIKASFTATYNGQKATGDIILAGNRFHVATQAMTTWYDGRTQWSYSLGNHEVSVSEPTAEELTQVNPFAIMESLRADYTARRVTAPKGYDMIELKPKGQSDYSKIMLAISSATSLPSEIVFYTTDGSVTSIKITDITRIKAPAAATFRFDAKKYPGVDVIDLR